MNLKIEIEQEEDGCFIAEVIDFPGVLAYGSTRQETVVKVQALDSDWADFVFAFHDLA
jgi:predicted RNase H-like HicB family nuclease